MSETDQSVVLSFLATPAAFGDEAPVERMETHISVIFLCGERALKLKKARALPYLDFSTLAKRRTAAEAEVAINSRTAPGLYKGVRTITRDAKGTLALDGVGDVIEVVVEMARFDQRNLLDAMAARGALTRAMMEDLADATAVFHRDATPCPSAGGGAAMAAIIENNSQAFALAAPETFQAAQVARVSDASKTACQHFTPLLDQRRRAGLVKTCHGDMHLRNIVLLDGQPTLFDAIEFNAQFSQIDVFYDLAFLLMDLDHRGLRRLANIIMNRYVDVRGDTDGVVLLPLLLSMRAAIRAHVGGVAVSQAVDPVAEVAQAREYLAMAERYLAGDAARVIAVGGLSGSGKSRLARELAPYIGGGVGCRVVRTDATRKRLAGVGILDKLPPESYTPAMSDKTYAAVLDEARALVQAGRPVVVDAVFSKPAERAAVEAVAIELGVPFHGLWLEAPADVMKARADKRKRNASDATASVVEAQLSYDLGDIGWSRVDSSRTKEETLASGLLALGVEMPSQIFP